MNAGRPELEIIDNGRVSDETETRAESEYQERRGDSSEKTPLAVVVVAGARDEDNEQECGESEKEAVGPQPGPRGQ